MHSENDISNVLRNKYALHNVPYNKLLDKIQNKEISKIYFSNKYSEVIAENKYETTEIYEDYTITDIIPQVTNDLIDISVKNKVEPIFKIKTEEPNQLQILAYDTYLFINNTVFPFILISILFSVAQSFFAMTRGGSGKNNGNSNGPFGQNIPGSLNIDLERDKEIMKNSNITLKSFAGSPEIFEECTEIVSYLKNGTIYEQAGAQIPRGILLEGPPGTGKTLLAKAIASDTDANFISITASEFVEVFVGVGAAKVRSLFEKARKNKPCIIFIDEFDSIGKQRGAGPNMANDEREQTLNQLLAEMDGFADNDGILIIGATNRKDILDPALLRPGRFDRIIKVSLPDKTSRLAILRVHSRNKELSTNVNLEFVAELTSGFSGAQLKNLLNEAAIYTARRGETIIQNQDILDSLEKLIVGLIRKVDTRSDEARRRVAIHEIGHAFLCSLYNDYFDLKKVTIQSTYNGAGGYTLFNERQNITESGLYTKDMYKKQLIIAMGGKAAENIYYGNSHISVGAIQDLKQANGLAEQMIGNYGMGETLEPFYNKNLDPMSVKSGDSYSEKTKVLIDEESINLVNDALNTAKKILLENKDKLDILVDKLLEKTTLYNEEFDEILNNEDDCECSIM
jgi:cell division protease FtsH